MVSFVSCCDYRLLAAHANCLTKQKHQLNRKIGIETFRRFLREFVFFSWLNLFFTLRETVFRFVSFILLLFIFNRLTILNEWVSVPGWLQHTNFFYQICNKIRNSLLNHSEKEMKKEREKKRIPPWNIWNLAIPFSTCLWYQGIQNRQQHEINTRNNNTHANIVHQTTNEIST